MPRADRKALIEKLEDPAAEPGVGLAAGWPGHRARPSESGPVTTTPSPLSVSRSVPLRRTFAKRRSTSLL